MKKISIMIPTYNEEDNVGPLSKEIIKVLEKEKKYTYEILFIDNHSTDKTRDNLRKLCKENKNIKAIFNAKNFGQFNSPFYALLQTTGDCTICMCADFQDPVDMIPKFIREWETGYKIVIGIKSKSKENKLMYLFRTIYYKLIKKFSTVDQIEHFTGFGLYDKKFVDVLKKLDDPKPYMRGIVAELGYERKEIEYTQEKRKTGKTKNNFFSLYDAAMLGFTSYTKIGLRIATFLGMIISMICFIVALVYLVLKLIYWNNFVAGMAPLLIGIFFLGGIQMFFIGLLGEYILSINSRIIKRPLVIEEERINFNNEK